jgi:hypothetical protein
MNYTGKKELWDENNKYRLNFMISVLTYYNIKGDRICYSN